MWCPDQRGFGYTGLAKNDARDADSVPLYDMQHLCGDLAAMLDALDIDQAVFAGHDWGGLVTWALPFYHPSRLAGLIGVNTPFIPRLTQDPVEAFARQWVMTSISSHFRNTATPKPLWMATQRVP